jgi:iron complex outermembrane recepter protein
LVKNPQNDFFEERGKITSKGFEFGVIGNISKSIVVNLNYTFTDAIITEDLNQEIIGFRNFGVANNTANAMLRYKVIEGRFKNLSFGLGSQYTGERSAVFAGFSDAKDKDKSLPSYHLVDSNISYEVNKVTIGMNAFNIFNVNYFDTGSWNSATDTTLGYFNGRVGNPSNFMLSINYKI